jgi:hypothetical protein
MTRILTVITHFLFHPQSSAVFPYVRIIVHDQRIGFQGHEGMVSARKEKDEEMRDFIA